MSHIILVVDDEPDVLELIEFNLKGGGFKVVTAVDGETALMKARTLSPSLIILDVMLPEIDGMEVCKQLRRDPSTARIPIIMLTAKAAEIDRVLGLELGADDYVTKPFSPRELVLRVKGLLRRKDERPEEGKERILAGDLVIRPAPARSAGGGKASRAHGHRVQATDRACPKAGRVQSRDQLLRDAWDYDSLIDTRTGGHPCTAVAGETRQGRQAH